MGRTVYLDGAWLPEEQARVSVFDRGFLFADAIYEVTAVIDSKLIDFDGHTARLQRSLDAMDIQMPLSAPELLELHKDIAQRNGMTDGLIYLQISRGQQDRDFLYSDDLKPTLVMFTQAKKVLDNPKWKSGLSLKTAPEGRWVDRQIKTVQLLYSSRAKMEASRAGFDDVLFVENGMVTEASAANFHIVTRDGTLVTRELSNALLHGITRGSILDLARTAGIPVEERSFTPQETLEAAEAFISSATSFVMPVVSLDGQPIGDGKPGPVSARLLELYIDHSLANGIPVSGPKT